MKKFITFLIFTVFQLLNAQYTVTGIFTNKEANIKNVALYKIIRGQAEYVKYVDVKNKQFTFSMDSLPVGNYRALYQNRQTGYVDFIYNNENVKFNINSKKGQSSVVYLVSKENQLLQTYNYNIRQVQYKLDSVQLKFFNAPKIALPEYKKVRAKAEETQKYYESLAKNSYCLGIIKASKRHNAVLPFASSNEYLKSIKNHFFDYINFKDKSLRNSMFLKGVVNDYVFYLSKADDILQQNNLYIKAIKEVLAKAEEDTFKEEILHFLTDKFIALENTKVVTDIVDLYKKLPQTVQHKKLLAEVAKKSKTMLGAIAPDFKISSTKTLYSLNNTNKYLVIFWSSTCPHCANQLPKVKELINLKKDITVITIGLESVETQKKWETFVKAHFKGWKNIIALGKWESKEAILYSINATPTYFLLNKNKQIIAKPYNFKVLKETLK